MNNSDLVTLVKAIVSGQKQIIGPMAVEQANKVPGIRVAQSLDIVDVSGESEQILKSLIRQYEQLFGQASVEACKDSVKKVLPSISSTKLPEFLR